MTLPASIRVNAQFPFPSLLIPSGPVTVTKQNGIWTVGFSISNLGDVPGGTPAASLEVLVYNTQTQSFQQATLSSLSGLFLSTRTVTATGAVAVLTTDRVLLWQPGVAAPVSFQLPSSVSWFGRGPLSFKDLAGNAAANNMTLLPNGGDTIDGAASLVMNDNYEAVTLNALPNGGWWVG
jgi:hypothetical protein